MEKTGCMGNRPATIPPSSYNAFYNRVKNHDPTFESRLGSPLVSSIYSGLLRASLGVVTGDVKVGTICVESGVAFHRSR